MVVDDINDWSDISRIYKGYFQIIVGTTRYKLLHPVSMQERVRANYATHYSTSGKKKLASTGYDASYTIALDNTVDLYATNSEITASTITNATKKTISYFIDKIFKNETPEIEFEGVEETDSADTTKGKFIVNQFRGVVVSVDRGRETSQGTYQATLHIDILEKVKVERATTAPT